MSVVDVLRRGRGFVLALLGVLVGGTHLALASTTPVIGWIEIKSAGKDQITVTGHALATVSAEGKFQLALTRKSRGNSAKTGQSGSFKVAAGEDAVLSSTGINVGPGEELVIELKLIVDGQEVYTVEMRSAPVANESNP